jgi:hypothetical protein
MGGATGGSVAAPSGGQTRTCWLPSSRTRREVHLAQVILYRASLLPPDLLPPEDLTATVPESARYSDGAVCKWLHRRETSPSWRIGGYPN